MIAAARLREALRRHITPRLAAGVLLAILCVWVSAQTVRTALVKSYAIDEFAYAHAAWLVSEGEVPYRDFFDHHFPLVYQLLALPFLFAHDAPEAIFVLRVLMLPVAALTALAAWHLSSRPRGRDGPSDKLVALLAPALMFSVARFTAHATEIRPARPAVVRALPGGALRALPCASLGY